MKQDMYVRYRAVKRPGLKIEQLGHTEVVRLDIIKRLIPGDVKKVIDVGCGEGMITNPLVETGLSVVGVDVSIGSLKFLSAYKTQATIDELPFGDDTFELVICSSVLEHLNDELLHTGVKELMRISSRYILISTPYNEILWKSFTKCPKCGSIYHKNLHLRSFDQKNLIEVFPGYEVVRLLYGADEDWKSGFLVWIAQHLFNRYAYSLSDIRCPVCGIIFSKQSLNSRSPEFEYRKFKKGKLRKAEKSGLLVNSILQRLMWFREVRPTHIAILFEKS
jgi:SAM-dependent methyltransferase